MECNNDGEIGSIGDCEEHENCRMMRFQRLKIWDVVSFFASILNQDWQKEYEVGDEGISDVVHV